MTFFVNFRHRLVLGHQGEYVGGQPHQVVPDLRLPGELQPGSGVHTLEEGRRRQGASPSNGLHPHTILQGQQVTFLLTPGTFVKTQGVKTKNFRPSAEN